jgi:hypothetical protein
MFRFRFHRASRLLIKLQLIPAFVICSTGKPAFAIYSTGKPAFAKASAGKASAGTQK